MAAYWICDRIIAQGDIQHGVTAYFGEYRCVLYFFVKEVPYSLVYMGNQCRANLWHDLDAIVNPSSSADIHLLGTSTN